ncbi:hypothetical protein [Alicyclobacillus sp. ALC3]|uniref:hypothetical protein n=1 Tax=Alicyclobacillus sp. ALC3 TaxID=2796143 RepID=UPI0023794208|nr:hypothetical protein [Alicyclobacillus sp. ALC3]WDL96372.1 hypothetical protein JC200_18910 [Alicyclobacillus sp. ALC3]
MVWVNIDHPTRRYIVHATESCRHVTRKQETKHKGVGRMLDHGGWLAFVARFDAMNRYQHEYSGYELVEHC